MMFYRPPKKSIWGHSLRKMKPEKQKTLFDRFFERVVSDYSFATGSIFFQPSLEDIMQRDAIDAFEKHFMNLLQISEAQPAFSNLSEAQFVLCFNELINRQDLYKSGQRGATVTACYTISRWIIDGIDVPTISQLHLYFGAKPHVIPAFQFETMEHFEYIRHILEELKICKLKPKHLKGK